MESFEKDINAHPWETICLIDMTPTHSATAHASAQIWGFRSQKLPN